MDDGGDAPRVERRQELGRGGRRCAPPERAETGGGSLRGGPDKRGGGDPLTRRALGHAP